MENPRETIYAALFALVSGAATFTTSSRRMRLIMDMQPEELPAIFQQQTGETTTQTRGIPPKYTMACDIAIYAANLSDTASATPELNALVDAVEAALQPDFTGVQTLGGLVSHCFISGKTEIFEGNLGNRAAAVIPIQILTT